MSRDSQKKLGRALVVTGLVVILGMVIYVLEVANGPGTGPKTFAQRRSYNQVKESVHGSFPLAFVVGVAGLGLSLAGARLARTKESDA